MGKGGVEVRSRIGSKREDDLIEYNHEYLLYLLYLFCRYSHIFYIFSKIKLFTIHKI